MHKKGALSLAELQHFFPPKEASKTYTHAELTAMYNKIQNPSRLIKPNEQLMENYVDYLTSAPPPIKGGATSCEDIEYDANTAIYADFLIKYPPEEIYPQDDWQKLKPLASYPTIFVMQAPSSDCEVLIRFFTFLSENGIRRYICLQCAQYESKFWKFVERFDQTASFLERSIEDWQPYTFENAMSIIACIEQDIKTPTVFHCTGGHGRTGSVIFLILHYIQCRSNPEILIDSLLPQFDINTADVNHVSKTLLAQECSYEAAEEFYKNKNKIDHALLAQRLNIANQAVANSLQLYYPKESDIAYKQYEYFQRGKREVFNPLPQPQHESIQFAKRLPVKEIPIIIVLADRKNEIADPEINEPSSNSLPKTINGGTRKKKPALSRSLKKKKTRRAR